MDSKQTGRKRTGLVVALALCCILAVGGVYAWFSAQDSKTNTFVQGNGVTERKA
ncbi:MAG: SipW-dependent-type signal peptide-containing protein [Collinsella intestinalis]